MPWLGQSPELSKIKAGCLEYAFQAAGSFIFGEQTLEPLKAQYIRHFVFALAPSYISPR